MALRLLRRVLLRKPEAAARAGVLALRDEIVTKHCYSLSSKLAALDVGETVWLEDSEQGNGPSYLERSIHTYPARSSKLAGRKFTSTRADAITVTRERVVLLRITRVE
jgi:hypothetical protein